MRDVTIDLRKLAIATAGLAAAACSASGHRIADCAASINATLDKAPLAAAAGDTIRVSFVDKPEWDQAVSVSEDGSATFLGLDSIPVAGKTAAQLDELLTKRYSTLNTDRPIERPLTVELFTAAGADAGGGAAAGGAATVGGGGSRDRVFVIGEVHSPGALPFSGRTMTLIEAIAAAGGHDKRTANLHNTILVRRLANGELRQWRLDAGIYEWGQVPAIYLQARDIVFVPNTAIDEVNIWVDQYIRQMLPFPYLVSPP